MLTGAQLESLKPAQFTLSMKYVRAHGKYVNSDTISKQRGGVPCSPAHKTIWH